MGYPLVPAPQDWISVRALLALPPCTFRHFPGLSMCSCRCWAGPVTACPRPEAPRGVPRDLSVLEARVSAGPAPRPSSAALGNRSVCPSRRTGGRGGQHGEPGPSALFAGRPVCGFSGVREAGQGRAEPEAQPVCRCGRGLWPAGSFQPPSGKSRPRSGLPFLGGPGLLSPLCERGGAGSCGPGHLRDRDMRPPSSGSGSSGVCPDRPRAWRGTSVAHGCSGSDTATPPATRRRLSSPFREYLTGTIPHSGRTWLHPSNVYDVRAVCWAWHE